MYMHVPVFFPLSIYITKTGIVEPESGAFDVVSNRPSKLAFGIHGGIDSHEAWAAERMCWGPCPLDVLCNTHP